MISKSWPAAEGLFTGTKLAEPQRPRLSGDVTRSIGASWAMAASMESMPGAWAISSIVMGAETYGHAAGVVPQSDNAGDRAALEDLMQVTGGVKVSGSCSCRHCEQ